MSIFNTRIIEQEAKMRCHRCNCSMVYEKFYGEEEAFWGWKCIFCGEVIDPVILENRYSEKRDRDVSA